MPSPCQKQETEERDACAADTSPQRRGRTVGNVVRVRESRTGTAMRAGCGFHGRREMGVCKPFTGQSQCMHTLNIAQNRFMRVSISLGSRQVHQEPEVGEFRFRGF